METNYQVRNTVQADGERMYFLLDPKGIPLFEPTLFMLTELRTQNLAAKTIESALRSLLLLQIFLDERGIDMQDRLKAGTLLDSGDIEALVLACGRKLAELRNAPVTIPLISRRSKLLHIEKFRMKAAGARTPAVTAGLQARRLRDIRAYIEWLAQNHLISERVPAPLRPGLAATIETFHKIIDARLPEETATADASEREGLDPRVVSRIREILDPLSNLNPFTDEFCRVRNQLMIDWFYVFGLRRGELLGIKTTDIDSRNSTVTGSSASKSSLAKAANGPTFLENSRFGWTKWRDAAHLTLTYAD